MQLIKADFSRRIDVPGVGSCPRPVDVDQSITGFARLVSFTIDTLPDAAVLEADTDDDEVFVIMMRGAADISVTGEDDADYNLSDTTGPRAVYLPPKHHYILTLQGEADIAFVRARAKGYNPLEAFNQSERTDGVVLANVDSAERLEFKLVRVGPGATVEVVTRSGSPLPERIVHVQSTVDDQMALEQGGNLKSLGVWDSVALGAGEPSRLKSASPALALIIAAR